MGRAVEAEDGIRDGHVTGVQTCALPISEALLAQAGALQVLAATEEGDPPVAQPDEVLGGQHRPAAVLGIHCRVAAGTTVRVDGDERDAVRSEERRVGKGGRWGGRWKQKTAYEMAT